MRRPSLIFFLLLALTLGGYLIVSAGPEKYPSDHPLLAERDTDSTSQKFSERDTPSKKRIENYFKELMRLSPRPVGSEKLRECRLFLMGTLKSFSLDVWEESFTADTPKGPFPMANVIAQKNGRGQGIIYLGSHIDTKHIEGIEIMGANDSGASTAALLELARVISDKDTELTYRFIFFDGEESIEEGMTEIDGLYGSKYHVLKLRQEENISDVRAMILLDMMGDKDLAINRDYNSSQDLWRLFASCCQRLEYGDIARGPATSMYDDHVPFLEAGIPALDIIDFSYGPDNSYWHTEEDTADKVSVENMFKITQVVLCMIDTLDGN
jgi:glutaminyl-peptide cyclotransferase